MLLRDCGQILSSRVHVWSFYIIIVRTQTGTSTMIGWWRRWNVGRWTRWLRSLARRVSSPPSLMWRDALREYTDIQTHTPTHKNTHTHASQIPNILDVSQPRFIALFPRYSLYRWEWVSFTSLHINNVKSLSNIPITILPKFSWLWRPCGAFQTADPSSAALHNKLSKLHISTSTFYAKMSLLLSYLPVEVSVGDGSCYEECYGHWRLWPHWPRAVCLVPTGNDSLQIQIRSTVVLTTYI